MSYEVSERAAEDFTEISDFTSAKWGEAQSGKYLVGLEDVCRSLGERQLIGRSAARVFPGLRRIEHGRHIIFYSILDNAVRIERVLHERRALKRKDFSM
ncbi:MAG: type II toxin-antitoxin system RelE/ParE family toxin [Acidobacteriota bacterium]